MESIQWIPTSSIQAYGLGTLQNVDNSKSTTTEKRIAAGIWQQKLNCS